MHLHSETDATSTSSTTKISAPSKPAANKHRNIDPILDSIRAYKNQPALASKRGHPRRQDSILSHLSVERYAPRLPAKTISRDASARRQSSSSASRLFAESLHRATRIHHASQIASATPSRCDHRTN